MLNYNLALDGVFHALADPARRSMLDTLSIGPASVSELARPLEMTFSAALQHLRALEGSGLVTSRKRGRVRTCHLEVEVLQTAESWLGARRARLEQRLDGLGEYLEREESGV